MSEEALDERSSAGTNGFAEETLSEDLYNTVIIKDAAWDHFSSDQKHIVSLNVLFFNEYQQFDFKRDVLGVFEDPLN